jgi:hypothetical protein
MHKRYLVWLFGLALAAPASGSPWVRGFAIDNYEPAFYYGGKLGTTDDPGSDCPKGTNPDNNYKTILRTPWRNAAQVDAVVKGVSAGFDPNGPTSRLLTYRGFRSDIETYINPFAAPDPGMQQVTGKIAEGFNLDGNVKTGGFNSASGEKGIDNAFYRAWGCLMSFRGTPYHAYMSQRANDKMVDGMYTMVMRVSGHGDPMNDDDATLEVGYSPDHLVKDPNGNVVDGYSFRIAKSAQYTKLRARIHNGVVETEQVADLYVPAFAWAESNRGEAAFHKGKIRLTINADGSASALLGGYRDWRDLYGKDTFNVPSGGTTRETYTHQNQISAYYALKRNADGLPDPKTGRNLGISAAFRVTAKSAFVLDPKTPVVIDQPPGAYANFEIPNIERALFIKASSTAQLQAAPVRHGHNPDSGSDPGSPPDGKAGNDVQASSQPPEAPASAAAVSVQ